MLKKDVPIVILPDGLKVETVPWDMNQIGDAHIMSDPSGSDSWSVICANYQDAPPIKLLGYKPNMMMWGVNSLRDVLSSSDGLHSLSEHCEGWAIFLTHLKALGSIEITLGESFVRAGMWVNNLARKDTGSLWGDGIIMAHSRDGFEPHWEPPSNGIWISKESAQEPLKGNTLVLSTDSPSAFINQLLSATSYKGNVVCEPAMESADVGSSVIMSGRRFVGYCEDHKQALHYARVLFAASQGLDLKAFNAGQRSLDQFIQD